MTLLVRNEEDIIRDNIEFHLSQGVDFIIATDNLSDDSTTQILLEFEKKGVLKYILEEEDNFNQHAWVTKMARMASREYEADWVINNDADEFWWPISGNLKSTFKSIASEYNTLKAHRTDFVALQEIHTKFYQSMVYAKHISLSTVGKPLPPKTAHLAINDIIVSQGNHQVKGFPKENKVEGLIDILHFPLRTKKQFLRKILNGGAAYQRNTELGVHTGDNWKHLYREYHNNGLIYFFKNNILDTQRVETNTFNGKLIKDYRLREYIRKMPVMN